MGACDIGRQRLMYSRWGEVLFYVLVTYKVTSGWVHTYDSAYSWRLFSAAPLGNQVVNTMTSIILSSPWLSVSVLIKPDTWTGSDKY